MSERTEQAGHRPREYPRDAFLDAVQEQRQVSETKDIAEEVGCAHSTAYKRLQSLEEEGEISSQKTGNSRFWFMLSEERWGLQVSETQPE